MVDEMKEGIMERDEAKNGAWEDVTGQCTLEWANLDRNGGNIEVAHNGAGVAWVGHDVKDGWDARGKYRLTATPEAPDDSIKQLGGAIKVEHFIPDPEPVIAYKAVIERDGEYVSTFAGGDHDGARKYGSLTYCVGEVTESTEGEGVFCFDTLEATQRAYPADRNDSHILRKKGRVVILKVEGIDDMSPGNLNHNRYYKSVKVLSVAWEEEKKEEWVNVTEECKVRTYNFPTLGSWFALEHDGNSVAHLGAETKILARNNYRITLDDFGKGNNNHAGHIKVEKRND